MLTTGVRNLDLSPNWKGAFRGSLSIQRTYENYTLSTPDLTLTMYNHK